MAVLDLGAAIEAGIGDFGAQAWAVDVRRWLRRCNFVSLWRCIRASVADERGPQTVQATGASTGSKSHLDGDEDE